MSTNTLSTTWTDSKRVRQKMTEVLQGRKILYIVLLYEITNYCTLVSPAPKKLTKKNK